MPYTGAMMAACGTMMQPITGRSMTPDGNLRPNSLPKPHPRLTHHKIALEGTQEVPRATKRHMSMVQARNEERELQLVREEVQHLEAFEDKMNKYLLQQKQRQAMLNRITPEAVAN